MESNESSNLLKEIRDELRKMNGRLEWLEKTAKEEMTKPSLYFEEATQSWKGYIPGLITIVLLIVLIYLGNR